MKCPACQFESPEGMKFCGECGSPLKTLCPRCGFENPPGFKFCGECGTGLVDQNAAPTLSQRESQRERKCKAVPRPVEHQAPEAERRQLTVMFCDLVGSTDLSEQLDPEELREVVRAYQEVSADVISRLEGHIAQYLGDGLLVYFGYPVAHEDDAQRAVRSGLGILQAMGWLNERLRDERGITLAVRIGIHTGLVVVGEIGGGEKREKLALGDTPNIAARVQGIANPNSVVISPTTYRLVQGFFDFESTGSHALKGVSEPMAMYRVLEEKGIYSRFEVAIRTGLTPLVGREEEVGKLIDCWQQVKDGKEHVVLIIGEAGIGKSRLLQVFRDRIASEAHTWMVCRCSPYYQNSALYPIIELIQRRLRFGPKDSSQEKLNKLEGALEPFGFDLSEAVPLLASLLSIPVSDHYPQLIMTPQKQKQKTLEALLSWLLKVAEQQPLIFVVENLHWADPSTFEHLSLLMDHQEKVPILVLLSFRPQTSPPETTRSELTKIILNRLGRDQIEAMVEKVTGGKNLPPEVLDQVVAKTDGVPLFVEELTKMVLESGLLEEEDGIYSLSKPLPQLAIPSTLQDSLMARLDRLGTIKEVAQLGATLGREFPYELIRAVSPFEDLIIREELSKLVEAEVLYQQGVLPQARYTFRHALIQDAAYESLLKGTRQKYHQKTAQVLEKHFTQTAKTHPEILAHHYTEAGMKAEAIAYWYKAGQIATQHSANLEAIGHLTKGLALVGTLPETTERNQQELKLQVALGVPMTATRGFAATEVERVYARARALCQELGATPQLFPVLRGLWLFYLVRAELRTARELGHQLLRLAQRVEDSALLLEAHLVSGLTCFYLGDFTSAQNHLEEGIAIYDVKQHHSLAYAYGDDPGVVCLSYLALVLWFLGYPNQAVTRDEEAQTLAKEISHPFSLAFALNFSARLHQCCRLVQDVQERAEATIELSMEHGFTHWLTTGKILQGWAMTQQERGVEGIALMRDGLAAWQATGAEVSGPHCLAMLAEAYWKEGKPEEGLAILAEGFDAGQKNGEGLYEPELYRLKGELLLECSQRNAVDAEACFHQALDVARRQSAKSLELRAALSLSRLLNDRGKKKKAREMLEGIYGWFTEGSDTADLRNAKALLGEMS